jgi:hypothetical protein
MGVDRFHGESSANLSPATQGDISGKALAFRGEKDHLGIRERMSIMHNLRSIAIAAAGIVVLAIAAVFTVSLTLIAGAVLTLTLAARMLTLRSKKAPVYAKAKTQGQAREIRVWNDGRGTIIDL